MKDVIHFKGNYEESLCHGDSKFTAETLSSTYKKEGKKMFAKKGKNTTAN